MSSSILHESTTCKYCLQVFQEPIQLSCGHSGCAKCVKQQFAFEQLQKLNNNSTTLEVSCANCNKHTEVDKRVGVNSLKANTLLQETMAKLQSRKCGNECGADATFGCETCGALLCSNCTKRVHSSPLFKTHTLKPIEQYEQSRAKPCPEHNIDLNVFCISCNHQVCLMCSAFGVHKGESI
jgi:hypothetical protein